MANQVLRINCPDEKGLVYRVTEILYNYGLNIVSNHEFVDETTGHFFMRTEFEEADKSKGILEDLKAALPDQAEFQKSKIKDRSMVIMATKESHCLGDLLLRCSYGEIYGKVNAVISNHRDLEPLVKAFDVPFHYIPHGGLSRKEHESEILETLSSYDPDYIVLAKYMRIFTAGFVEQFENQIINIHHSFLPAFAGAAPYRQAYERGVKIIGATAHFVTDELDEGPIISQDVLPVNHSYTAQEMAYAGRDIEKIVLAKALKLVLEERVFIHKNRTVVFE